MAEATLVMHVAVGVWTEIGSVSVYSGPCRTCGVLLPVASWDLCSDCRLWAMAWAVAYDGVEPPAQWLAIAEDV